MVMTLNQVPDHIPKHNYYYFNKPIRFLMYVRMFYLSFLYGCSLLL